MPEEKIHKAIAGVELSKRQIIREYFCDFDEETQEAFCMDDLVVIEAAMQFYADQQTNKLEKEIEGLKGIIELLTIQRDFPLIPDE